MATQILPSPLRGRWGATSTTFRLGWSSLLALFDRRPLLSVVLSVLSYSFFGPLAALVIVATMLDHEFAHWALMRRLGYNPGPVRLIPFVGALVKARRPMLRSADIARVYLAGPLAGVLSAAVASLVASHTLSPALCHQIYIGSAVAIALNLFNLVPLEPLDGGLVSRVLPYQALLLFPLVITVWLIHRNLAATPLGVVVVVGAVWLTVRKVAKWRRYVAALHGRVAHGDIAALRELRASVEVPLVERFLVVGAYIVLVPGALGLFTALSRAGGWLG